MNTETKQLFNAPWHISGDGCQIDDNNGNEVTHTNDDVKTAYRLARLPELYDALAAAIREACWDCVEETELRTGMLFDTVHDGCIYPERDCCETCRGWIALLNKVKEGK